MKRRLLLGLFAIVLLALASGGLWLRHEWQIDSSLDNGGRWNHLLAVCERA